MSAHKAPGGLPEWGEAYGGLPNHPKAMQALLASDTSIATYYEYRHVRWEHDSGGVVYEVVSLHTEDGRRLKTERIRIPNGRMVDGKFVLAPNAKRPVVN